MNQTRVFLIFAWLMVATLLWMEWGRFTAPGADAEATAAVEQSAFGADARGTVPGAPSLPATAAGGATPAVPTVPATSTSAAPAPASTAGAARVVASSDVLRLTLDGGSVLSAELLKYNQDRSEASPPVQMLTEDPSRLYVAQSGWVSPSGAAPSHEARFVPEQGAGAVSMARQATELQVPFIWNGPDGVSIRRIYTLRQGDYAVRVRDEVINRGSSPWQGFVYRQLLRVPPQIKTGMTNPESFSFMGATWYDDGYNRRPFTPGILGGFFSGNFLEEGENELKVDGGWIAIPQHHFLSAWIPKSDTKAVIELAEIDSGSFTQKLIRTRDAVPLMVAPGTSAATEARLYIGPKRIEYLNAQGVPGLDRAVDYSQFDIFALIGKGLFWVLSHLHTLFGNWGWSIMGLVFLVKLAMYPLSKKQYQSFAKMRQFQPRIAQLKERYGDDRAKFQAAMMELYKKEKINPMGGCLPILVQMPVFLALYWVLVESVELRQAPWVLWIQDLTARDPFFILPVLNMVVMYLTQKLTPSPGMDPMQQKMMQLMPLIFGVMMAFFPSGLVLYWVTNGTLGLLQQWWMTKQHGQPPPSKALAK